MILAIAGQPFVGERGLSGVLDHGFVHGNDAGLGPHRVVELRGLERLTELGIPVRVTGTIERQHRDVVHAQVVGMWVTGLIVAIGDDDLRLRPADDRDQTADCLVEIGLVEATGMLVRRRLRHAESR